MLEDLEEVLLEIIFTKRKKINSIRIRGATFKNWFFTVLFPPTLTTISTENLILHNST